MNKGHWLPDREQDLVDLAGIWELLLSDSVKKMEFNWDSEECGKVLFAISEFKQARADYAANRNPGKRLTKDAKKSEMRSCMQDFAVSSVRFNKRMSAADKLFMCVREVCRTRSYVGAPSSRALITALKALGGFQIEVHVRDEDSPDSRAVPYGFAGYVLHFAWGPRKLMDYSALSQSVFLSRSIATVVLPPVSEGMFFSCYTQWLSKTGKLGPLSDIHHTVIV